MRLCFFAVLALGFCSFLHFSEARAEAEPMPEDRAAYLSVADLVALGDSHSTLARALDVARQFQTGKELQLQAVLDSAEGQTLSPLARKLLQGLPVDAKASLLLLIRHGAGRDSRGLLSLGAFRFEDLRQPEGRELIRAFETLFPSAQGRWTEILDPRRKHVVLIEGQALLPPAFKTAEPGLKFTPAVSWSAYESAVAQELEGLNQDLRLLLEASRQGGTFGDLLYEVGAFYSNDAWGKPRLVREQEAASSAAQDRSGIRIRRLKAKWGFSRQQLDAALMAYAQVVAQASANRELALSDLGAKATAIAVAPLLYPVAALGLMPAFAGGMLITGADIVAGAAIERSTRGGSLSSHLARQLDEKLPHGFTLSLLFSPAGLLHKAAQSGVTAVRAGARVASVGLAGAAGTSAVQSGISAAQAHDELGKVDAKADGVPSELSRALQAERAQGMLRAATDSIFAVLGLRGALLPATKRAAPPARFQSEAGPARGALPVAAAAEPLLLPELPPAASEAIATERQRLIALRQKGHGTPEKRLLHILQGGEPGELPSRPQFLTRVTESARKLLLLHGVELVAPMGFEGAFEPLQILPVKDGHALNRTAWLLNERCGTRLVFDPDGLDEEASTAFYSPNRNLITLSYQEVLRGSRSRVTSLKHEVRHLIRDRVEDLPLRGYVRYDQRRPGPYGDTHQFDEVISHAWDLVDLAKATRTEGRTPYLSKRIDSKVNLLLDLLKNTEHTLRATRKNLDKLRVKHLHPPFPPYVEGQIPDVGYVRFKLNAAQRKRLDPDNFPKEMGTADRAIFMAEERNATLSALDGRLEAEIWLVSRLADHITPFRNEAQDALKLIQPLEARLEYLDIALKASGREQLNEIEALNQQAREAQTILNRLYQDLTHGRVPFDSLESADELSGTAYELRRQATRRYGMGSDCLECRREHVQRLAGMNASVDEMIRKFSAPLNVSRANDHLARARSLRSDLEHATGAQAQSLKESLLSEVSNAYTHLTEADAQAQINALKKEFPAEMRALDEGDHLMDEFEIDFDSLP